VEPVMRASELNPICRACGILSIGCPFSDYGVLHIRRELHLLNHDPEGDEFLYMNRSCNTRPKGSNPTAIL
jgi:hypothetical protein